MEDFIGETKEIQNFDFNILSDKIKQFVSNLKQSSLKEIASDE